MGNTVITGKKCRNTWQEIQKYLVRNTMIPGRNVLSFALAPPPRRASRSAPTGLRRELAEPAEVQNRQGNESSLKGIRMIDN